MAKPAHPAKEKVSQWLVKQDEKKGYASKKEAIDAAIAHFSNEGLNSGTVGLWVGAALDKFAPKARTGNTGSKRGKKGAGAPTSFADLQGQLQRIQANAEKEAAQVKTLAVKALIGEARAVAVLHAEYANAEEALKANIELAAQLTGQKSKDIQAQIDAALNG